MIGTRAIVGLRGDQAQERGHRLLAVEQAVVHVDVDDLGAVLDLLARDAQRRLVVAGLDQALEARRAGDVGALADVDEGREGVAGGRRRHLEVLRWESAHAAAKGSSPDSRSVGLSSGTWRGGMPATASAIALMCAGVVPQQPPTMFTIPLCAHSRSCVLITSGPSSYSPSSFGSPALG